MSFQPRSRPARRSVARRAVALLLVLGAAGLAACGSSASRTRPRSTGSRTSFTVRDDFGTDVALAPVPQRIVSLNPTTTELLFALGAAHRVVGRSRWDVWPAAATEVPAVGDAIHPAVEQVLAARPDLVLLYATADNRAAYDRIRGAGIRVLALRIDHIAQFERAARLLGRAIGDSAAGDSVADSVATTLARVRRETRALPHPTVVWPVSDAPPIVIGGGSYMSELLDIAGAVNLYAGSRAPSPVVSVEDVVVRDPDIVVRGGDDLPSRAWSATWSVVPAVREGHVAQVPTDLVSRPSVQLGAAAVALARALHPGAPIQ
jgi:ABC-type Fe3+-hydroxamate transport system substrate-binding protein